MAVGNYARIDGNNSSNCCLIVTIAVFVSTCLIGAWMTMSSSNGHIRMGITYEEFIGGIPKVGGSVGSLPYDTVKGNSSKDGVQDANNPNMQGNENEFQEEFQSPDSNENQKIEPKEEQEPEPEKDLSAPKAEEESVSGYGKNDTSAQQINDGKYGENASYQKATKENSEDDLQQKNATDGKSGPKAGQGELKQAEERETKVEGSNPDKKPGKTKTSAAVMTPPTQPAQILPSLEHQTSHRWKICNVSTGPDYIPCLDNIRAVRKLPSWSHYEHMERHCPNKPPTCLVRLPKGYRIPIKWPKSRDMIWLANAPHTKLVEYKKPQNWVKVSGQYLTFPGGGTQFKHGALHYIDFIQQTLPDISWGKRSRVILDVGCGVASFGGYLFERDVLTMSMAPKDVHEAQVQFALERGIPAISAVMGTQRLPFPALVFDVVHCARCRVPWHNEGGRLLLELDRVLRPGGYFVWSATPVYRKGAEDVTIWKAMSKLTKSMCWELVQIGKDKVNGVSAAIYRKPTSNDCYESRQQNDPPLCDDSDDPNAAWYTPLQPCIHKVPTDPSERGAQWPPLWSTRLEKPPYWLKSSEVGAPDKLASKKFIEDSNYWKQIIGNSYLSGIGIDWSSVRNVMDMNASYGGFAAALKDSNVWVMNVVLVNSSDTLPVIYERGLFGVYHDWCESFNTYPRSYDLLHANHLFSDLKKRCNFVAVLAEIDRILRPETWLIVRDDIQTISEVETMAKSLQWRIKFSYSGGNNEGLLCIQKTMWRPSEAETIISTFQP